MKRVCVLIMLFASLCPAASLIQNGSFEDDIVPVGWEISLPAYFNGDIVTDWASHGTNSLMFYNTLYGSFSAGDASYIYQDVDLTDVNELIFDAYLTGLYSGLWDGSKVTAFVSIDSSDNYISTTQPGDDGIIYDINVPVDSYTGIHTLYFGLRVDVSEMFFDSYRVYIDFVKLDAFCGGFGHFVSDINRDCYVDEYDMDEIATNWLRDDLTSDDDDIDLIIDGQIDLYDFAFLADEWMECTNWSDSNCVEVPLDLDADINLDGIVNMVDYSILATDMNDSGIIDYNDLEIMNYQWLQKSWLYKN